MNDTWPNQANQTRRRIAGQLREGMDAPHFRDYMRHFHRLMQRRSPSTEEVLA